MRFLRQPEYAFKTLFRMSKSNYRSLLTWLRTHAELRDSRKATAGLKLMIFLWICAYNEPQRNAAAFFKISQQTVSNVFTQVLRCMQTLHTSFVQQPADGWVSADLLQRGRDRIFDDCLGYIDGVYVHAHIARVEDPHRFWCRKDFYAQNVFAAVRPDGTFSYVLAGSPGSTHDSTLLGKALDDGFMLPEGRYYLGDSGFGSSRPGVVCPYPRTAYHLQQWVRLGRRPRTRKELLNRRHSQKRVKVEQTFGRIKRTWKIIRKSAAEYSFKKQIMLVYAITALHNFIYMDGDISSYLAVNDVGSRHHQRSQIGVPVADQRLGSQELRRRLALRIWRRERG